MSEVSPRSIALAHDWLTAERGGERVLERLAHLIGPTDIYTLVSNGRVRFDAISKCRVITSPLQKFPGASGGLRRWYLPLMPWAVGQIKVKPCDVLISTSSAVMKSIIPPPGTRHICYCHTPARYIWEQEQDYAHGDGGWLRSAGLKLIRQRFQEWDRRTADRVTMFIANSEHTAARIKRCYDRDSIVVYPPVRTEFFTPDSAIARENWLLVVAALEPYKRTELVIEAANRARIALKVVGVGSQLSTLKRIAGPTVQMLGRVSDHELRELYRRARALVFPQIEDFGIIAVEAQSCGCPVIAFDGGGAKEIVADSTGILLAEQSAELLLEAVSTCRKREFDATACRQNALRFSESRFDDAILRIVNEKSPRS